MTPLRPLCFALAPLLAIGTAHAQAGQQYADIEQQNRRLYSGR